MAFKVIITEKGLDNQNAEHFIGVHFICLELNVLTILNILCAYNNIHPIFQSEVLLKGFSVP